MLLTYTLLALVAWPVVGPLHALALYCVLLLTLILRDRINLRVLRRWIRSPLKRDAPDARGDWGEAFAELARLLREQRKSERSLASSLKSFQQAGAAIPDGLVILGPSDHIEWCNPRAEQHLGLSRARDVGQQITYLVRAPHFAEHLRENRYGEPLMLRQTRGIDQTQVLSIQLVPFGDQAKLLLSRDVTQFERVERMRQDFVANVSHEMRTPLTVVIGFLETVLDMGAVTPAGVRPLNLAMDQALRMQRLVEDLLTLSRLESPANRLQEEPVDVPALMRTLHQEALALSAGRHRIELGLESMARVRGNAEELRSAFGNLVTNAITYTPQGGSIRLSWASDGSHVCFVVQDSGIGIEAQHIPRLTERFYRVDRSRSRETGGTGLGLAIVKHVLARHGAHLDIRSEPGKGSRFTAVFPGTAIAAEEAVDDAAAEST